MKSAFVLVSCLTLACSTHANEPLSEPFGEIDPVHMMRLFGACDAFLDVVANEHELSCKHYHPEVQRRTSQSDLPKWISADEVDGTVVVSWRVHSTFDGRVDAIELRAPDVAGLQREAAAVVSAVAAPAERALLDSITSSAGPKIGTETTKLYGFDVDVFRDFIGRVANQPWAYQIRWDVNLGL